MDTSDKSPLNYTNWKGSHGIDGDNCAYMITDKDLDPDNHGYWGDSFCSANSPRRFCTMCEFGHLRQHYTLLGLCNESRHDRVFYLQYDEYSTNKPFFKGFATSNIIWVRKLRIL